MRWRICVRTMSATSNSTCSIEAPVIVRVPVSASGGITVKEAEKILRSQGFRPATAAERKRNKKFLRASA
jgi:hypothetical protein